MYYLQKSYKLRESLLGYNELKSPGYLNAASILALAFLVMLSILWTGSEVNRISGSLQEITL